MKHCIFTVVASLCLVVGQSASACCLFPFFNTYSAGYAPGWGMNWGAGYAPAAYGYRGMGYGGATNCCPTGACGASYSAGYLPAAPNCCGTCVGGCASGCGSDCVGTETRKVPEPDINYDNRSPSSKPPARTFENDDTNRDRRDFQDRGNLDDRRDLSDEFSRPADDRTSPTDSWDRSRPRTDPLSTDPLRNEPAPGRTVPNFDTDSDLLNRNDGFGNPANPDSFGGSRYRPSDEQEEPETAPADAPEHSTRKPEVTTPMELPAEEESAAPEDTVPLPNSEESPGTETQADDFLPPEDSAQSRNSHFDVLSMQRLAGRHRSTETIGTQISSSRRESRAPRWISLPMPEGRERL